MASVYLDGFECLTVEDWKFLRQWNDGNLPATVNAWLNSSGYFSDPEVVEKDFEDYSDDDESGEIGFTDNFTQSATLYAKIATVSSNKVLHVYDKSVSPTDQVDTTLPFKRVLKYDNPSPANIFQFDIAIQKGDTYAGVCYSYYILIDHAGDEWLYFRVDHFTGQIDYSFDGTNYTDSTFDLSDESMATIYVQLTDDDKFKLKKDSGSWSAEITNTEGAYDTSIDSFQILTTVANKVTTVTPESGLENFSTYTPAGTKIRGVTSPIGSWNSWTEQTDCFFKSKSDGGTGLWGWFNDNSGSATITPDLSVTSHVMTAGEYVEIDCDCVALNANGGIGISVRAGATYLLYVVIDGTGFICLDGEGGNHWHDCNCGTGVGHNFRLRLTCVDDTHWKVAYSYDSGAWTDFDTIHLWSNAAFSSNAVTIIGIQGGGSSPTCEGYFHYIKPSWTYVAESSVDTIYPVEAWIDDISDEFFVGVNPANVRGKQVKIYNDDDKLIWKGYCKEYEKQVLEGDADYSLHCFDEFYLASKRDVPETGISYTGALDGNPPSNNLKVTPAITKAESLLLGRWACIRHTSGTVNYDQDAGASENAKTSSGIETNGPGSYVKFTSETNTHAKTQARDNDYHYFLVEAIKSPPEYAGYIEYLIDKTVVADQTPVSGLVRIVAKSTVAGSNDTGIIFHYVTVKNKNTGNYERIYSMAQNAHESNKDLTCQFPIKEEHIETTGGVWRVTMRLNIYAGANMAETLYIDYLRADVKVTKDAAYKPVEGKVDAFTDTTHVTINTVPLADIVASSGDSIIVMNSLGVSINDALSLMKDVSIDMMEYDKFVSTDERGNDGFTAFKRLSQRASFDFFLDIDGDDDPTRLVINEKRDMFDCAAVTTDTEVDDIDESWNVHEVQDNRIVVKRNTTVGSYLQFSFGAAAQPDIIYKLISKDLDSEPTRKLVAAEFYLSFDGALPLNGDYDGLRIAATNEDDPDAHPIIFIEIYNDLGTIVWKIHAEGDVGASSTVEFEKDDDKMFIIRAEIDVDNDTLNVYYRNVDTVGGARVLTDEWVLVTGCPRTYTRHPARSISFEPNGNEAATEFRLHKMVLEFQPEDFDGGAFTPGGDVTVQKKEDSIASLRVIGGKDSDGNDIVVDAVDTDGIFDPDGRHVVEVKSNLLTESEVRSYINTFMESYEEDLNAIRVSEYIENDDEMKVGYHYQFTIDGVSYDEILRRAECSWKNKEKAINWTLDFGKGKTFGKEKNFRSSTKNDASINELKLK